MREMLEPMFGANGAVVAQFVITLIAILILLGLIYWVIQRLSGVRLNGVGRGRGPRLAIIDALPVDSRRKLVLVRRDNVEHLILIGGTSDLVVEPSIIRGLPAGTRPREGQPGPASQPPRSQPQHRPGAPPAAPQAQPQAAAPHNNSETGISEPVPFPKAQPQQPSQPRPMPRAAEALPAPASAASGTVVARPVSQRRAAMRAPPAASSNGGHMATASAHFEEPTRPTRIESVLSLADGLDEIADEPMPAGNVTEFAGPKAPPPLAALRDSATTVGAGDEATTEGLEISPEPAPAIATDDGAADAGDSRTSQSASAAKVSDLEREMARLLGEITAKRDF